MKMTIEEVNALIDLIGNTRQVPIVQNVYFQTTTSWGIESSKRKMHVRWCKRRPGGLVSAGESIYEWNDGAWRCA